MNSTSTQLNIHMYIIIIILIIIDIIRLYEMRNSQYRQCGNNHLIFRSVKKRSYRERKVDFPLNILTL